MSNFKKSVFALTVSAMFAAPAAFAASSEGVIYQVDQIGSQAAISQVADDNLPQGAAIIQTDANQVNSGNATNNIATVIQGAVTDGTGPVTVDATGLFASSTGAATAAGGIAGVTMTDSSTPVFGAPNLADGLTGNNAYAYTVTGTSSNNYALTVQDHQIGSSANVVQGNTAEIDNAVINQNALANADLPATTAGTANPYAGGAGLSYTAAAAFNGADVVVTATAGTLTINYDGNDLNVADAGNSSFADSDAAPAIGNLAYVTQGLDLSFTVINGGRTVTATDADTSGTTTNFALAIQDGTNGYAAIGQQGTLNTAIALQTGDSNAVEAYQYNSDDYGAATGNFSLTTQGGNSNIAQTFQAGSYSTALVTQFGDGQVSLVDQQSNATAAGQGPVAFVYQSGVNNGAGAAAGSGNYASIYQAGTL